jgi:GTP cyclohydrolase II
VTPFRGEEPEQVLVEIGRAVGELRLGASIVVQGQRGLLEVRALEDASEDLFGRRRRPWRLLLTVERAQALGLPVEGRGAVSVTLPRNGGLARHVGLADPMTVGRAEVGDAIVESTGPDEAAALTLVKLARRLPAALVRSIARAPERAMRVTPEQIAAYPRLAGRSLRLVSEARVPLVDASQARVFVFRPADGGLEHMAIVVGRPHAAEPILCRLHSECFTGDVLGSLRCDCGDQLRGALRRMHAEGGGVLLYLAQEGRNIGLANKLRAYTLQDAGLDTVEANLHLGFESDERQWHGAARMLEVLGFARVRLLTNNPDKVDQLREHGIDVVERVPHAFAANDHNRDYLRTKAVKSGHALFDVLETGRARRCAS